MKTYKFYYFKDQSQYCNKQFHMSAISITHKSQIKRIQSQESILSQGTQNGKMKSTKQTNKQLTLVHPRYFSCIENKLQQGFRKILIHSISRHQAKKRISIAVNRIFRVNQNQYKFNAFQRLKRIFINEQILQYKETQKVFNNVQRNGCMFFVKFVKNKRGKILSDCLRTIKINTQYINENKRQKYLQIYYIIINARRRQLKDAWSNVYYARFIENRRRKVRQAINIGKSCRYKYLKFAYTMLKRRMLKFRQNRFKNDINQIDDRINTQDDNAQLTIVQQKQKKLEYQIVELNKQKQIIYNEFRSQVMDTQLKLNQKKQEFEEFQNHHSQLTAKIAEATEIIQQNYSMDEIAYFLYNNFIVFLNKNINKAINKKQLLNELSIPLLPLNLNLEKLRQQNLVMKQLIREYIILFGSKNLELEEKIIQLPYEYILKQNYLLHKIIVTLLERVNLQRNQIGQLREKIHTLSETVKIVDENGKRKINKCT